MSIAVVPNFTGLGRVIQTTMHATGLAQAVKHDPETEKACITRLST